MAAAAAEEEPEQQPVEEEPLPYDGDVQAAMRAQDRDAIKKIMAARSENPPPSSAAVPSLAEMSARMAALEVPAPAPSPTRSPTIHRPSEGFGGGYSSPGEYGGGMGNDDLDELDTILSDVEAPAPAPSWNNRSPTAATAAAPASSWRDAPAPAPGTSWMDAVMSEVESDGASNPFSVPSMTPANSTRGAAPAPFGPGGDDDDILKQLEASEARLNAEWDGAATTGSAAGGGGFGSPRSGDDDLDELDDLLEEFM
jgi:hypothetical protein